MAECLGDRIRKMRETYGMPAAVLAKRVKISRQQLYAIESSETENPGALTVLHIAEALGVSTDYLLKGKRKTRRLTDDVERPLTLPGMALETVWQGETDAEVLTSVRSIPRRSGGQPRAAVGLRDRTRQPPP